MITLEELDLLHRRGLTKSDAEYQAARRSLMAQARKLPLPNSDPQQMFLDSEADIVVFGGAAGGGKTYGLLLDMARNELITNPDYGFVIFRRESPQITNEGGLWDTSQIYRQTGAYSRVGDHSWHFPTGSSGRFAHMVNEDDKFSWQGTQLTRIGFDELTHFTESQFFYLLSRNRSLCGIKPRVRATCNPHPGWVKSFLGPWVDRDNPHYPTPSGELRWFTRIKGKIVWVDVSYRTPIEEIDIPPSVLETMSAQEIEDARKPKSVTFIRSTVYDNVDLMKKDPGYLGWLNSLEEVERARLLLGDWDALEGMYFGEWSEHRHVNKSMAPMDVPRWHEWFGGLDYGKSAPFCFLLMACDEFGNVITVDEIYEAGLEPSQQAFRVKSLLQEHGLTVKNVNIWADPSIFPPKTANSMIAHPGKYIAEEYWDLGLTLIPANNDRINGWTRVREYIHATPMPGSSGDGGGLTVLRKCRNLIRTMPLLPFDSHNQEDLDTTAEDHAADSLRYGLMGRPRQAKARPKVMTSDELKQTIATNTAKAMAQSNEANLIERNKVMGLVPKRGEDGEIVRTDEGRIAGWAAAKRGRY